MEVRQRVSSPDPCCLVSLQPRIFHKNLRGFFVYAHHLPPQPRRAASIAAMSIFLIVIIASNARLAAAGSGSVIASISATGVICQDSPHLSLHQPHSLSWPPLPTIASQKRSVSAWSAVA